MILSRTSKSQKGNHIPEPAQIDCAGKGEDEWPDAVFADGEKIVVFEVTVKELDKGRVQGATGSNSIEVYWCGYDKEGNKIKVIPSKDHFPLIRIYDYGLDKFILSNRRDAFDSEEQMKEIFIGLASDLCAGTISRRRKRRQQQTLQKISQ
jgi:hypothetical protein